MAVLGDARGGLSVVSLDSEFAGYTFAAHAGHVMDVFFRRDACTGAPIVYSGDNAETPSGTCARLALAACRLHARSLGHSLVTHASACCEACRRRRRQSLLCLQGLGRPAQILRHSERRRMPSHLFGGGAGGRPCCSCPR